ncbi:MAG TPA: ABC transporter permease [Conexivisphaerales archaeon]|nr:ABC transporter permease [Conexivisphaerales archaeon]
MKVSLDLNALLDILEPYFYGVLAALGVAGLLLYLLGFNPIEGYATLLTASFGSVTGLGIMLIKFIPLMLMALAFAVPMKAKKFNVGNEGQFLVGAIGAAVAALSFSGLPSFLALPFTLLSGIAFGALWALLPALMLYRFGVYEVISTISMNFISYQLVDMVALSRWRDPLSGQPMTVAIPPAFQLPLISDALHVSVGLFIALAMPFIVYFYLYRTVFGYELRAVGDNPRAASNFGIGAKLLAPLSLVIGGGLAGLAGSIEVAGYQLRLIEGMQFNYGPLSVIIAIIPDGHPIGIIFVTLLISVIEVGSNALKRTIGVPAALVFVMEALILLFVLLANVIKRRRHK